MTDRKPEVTAEQKAAQLTILAASASHDGKVYDGILEALKAAEQRGIDLGRADAWELAKAWDEGFAAGVKAMQGGPREFPPENPYGKHDLHEDCLCPSCRSLRRRRFGNEAADVAEEAIREKARAIFGNTGLPAPPRSETK
jgi:hypothetical protein